MSTNPSKVAFEPYISAAKSLPEITLKAVILSIILVLILGAANTYLGLKVGNTVSASIPAAVISMAVLRLFRRSNILENNVVQTSASAGEALAGGTLFTVPALLIMHYWTGFNYWQSAAICFIGGSLGVLFCVPIRRVLVNDHSLPFPEGTATANVLKAGDDASTGIKELLFGGLGGGLIALFQDGFHVVSGGFQSWFLANKTIIGGGVGFAPALFAAGYIIGVTVAVSVSIGLILGWILGMPLMSLWLGLPHITGANASTLATALWSDNTRYIGIGTMLVGALWCVLTLLKPMYHGIVTSAQTVRQARLQGHIQVPRTERDMSIYLIGRLVIALFVPLAALLFYFTYQHAPYFPLSQHIALVTVGLIVIAVFGFLLSSVCGYFAGLIGSSMSPVSGMALIVLLVTSVTLVLLIHIFPNVTVFHQHPSHILAGAIVIVVTAIVSCAAAISNDTIQDLKAGQLVGATPWKQQLMMFVGVAVSSLAIPAVLSVLYRAYGIGDVFPRAGMDPSQALMAPQASMMAAVVSGVFANNFHATMLAIGGGIAVIFLIIDHFISKRGYRISILSIGLGIYLPMEVNVPVALGGFLSYFISKVLERRARQAENSLTYQSEEKSARQRGLLLACGMVAGSALMGVILAIPFAIKGDANALSLVSASFIPYADFLGYVSLGILAFWIYKTVVRK